MTVILIDLFGRRKTRFVMMYYLENLEQFELFRRMDNIIQGFKKRMELQLASLNCNMETV